MKNIDGTFDQKNMDAYNQATFPNSSYFWLIAISHSCLQEYISEEHIRQIQILSMRFGDELRRVLYAQEVLTEFIQ